MTVLVLGLLAVIICYLVHLWRKYARRIWIETPRVIAVAIAGGLVAYVVYKALSYNLVGPIRVLHLVAIVELIVGVVYLVRQINGYDLKPGLLGWLQAHWLTLCMIGSAFAAAASWLRIVLNRQRPIRWTTLDGGRSPMDEPDYAPFFLDQGEMVTGQFGVTFDDDPEHRTRAS